MIVSAVVTLPMGLTRGKEYAELEWPITLLIAVVWVCYAVVFFGTLLRRKVRHIYVANWFFGGYIIDVTMLHVVNSASMPATLFKVLFRLLPGVQDAMVQWWYGHNAVGFFLTAGFLGHGLLLHPQAGRAPGVFVPAVDRALLGADLHLYVGRPAPPALHRTARLDAIDWAWCSR